MYSLRYLASTTALAALAAGLGACAPAMDDSMVGAQPSPGFTEAAGGMWAETVALHEGTVEDARFFVAQAQNQTLRTYAQQLVDDYVARQQRLTPLMERHGVTPLPGTQSQTLERTFRETAETLRGFEGEEYYRRWIEHQIAMNRWLIDAIDNSYMPSVQGRPDLVQELTTWRASVQRHLQEAERIRADWR
jgi:predicted outer membrane protein